MKIVFMGTPEFAVPTLDRLIIDGHTIVGVVTSTDKKLGRNKKKKHYSAVKVFALKHNLKILQPPNLKASSFVEELASLGADLFVVVAFRMLPRVVWELPPMGTINLHASLLPKYRGAAPINWAIAKGEQKTGLTTFIINENIDTGHILKQKETHIGKTETAGDLHDRMMHLGALLVSETVSELEQDILTTRPQNHEDATPAPKIYFEDCQLTAISRVEEAYNFIRGMSPYPAAWIRWEGKIIKIFEAQYVLSSHSYTPGTVRIDPKTRFEVYFEDGVIKPTLIQVEGKRKMKTSDFLNGLQ